MRRLRLTAIAACLLVWGLTGRASGQSLELVERTTPGWVLTPTVTLGIGLDSNPVLTTAEGDAGPSDMLTRATPGLDLSFNGRHTTLSGAYRGSLLKYRTLGEYDSYDQGGHFQFRHRASRRVDLLARSSFVVTPATDILELAGVPFFRAGTRQTTAEVGSGVTLSRRVSAKGAYQFQTVDFDAADPALDLLLRGGRAHGVTFDVKRQTNARVAVGGGFNYQHAMYGASDLPFHIYTGEATLSWRIDSTLDLDAGAGFSRLILPESGERSGPAARVALRKQTTHALYSVSASRSFVPSFGFGGGVMNQELTGSVQVPIARRTSLRSGVSWRGGQPVVEQELGPTIGLTSLWVHTSLGYALQRWARIEVFYNGGFQDTVVVGGRVDRHRFGIQFSTAAPMRIQ